MLVNDLLAIVVFIANVIFFIWFGLTLTSINSELYSINISAAQVRDNMGLIAGLTKYMADLAKHTADHAERQTRLLASIAQATATDTPPPPLPGGSNVIGS